MTTMIAVDGQRLALAVQFMSDMTPEGFMTLQPGDAPNAGVMFFKAVDTAGVAMAECKLKCTYEGDLCHIGMSYEEVPTDIEGSVILHVGNQLVLQTGHIRHKMDRIETAYVRKCGDVKVVWPFVFDMPAGDLKAYINAVGKKFAPKDTSAAIRFTWENNELIIEDKERTKIDITIPAEELHIRTSCDTKLESLFSADYMKNLGLRLGSFDRAVVGLGKDIPLNVGGTTPDGTVGCGIIISPRIGE